MRTLFYHLIFVIRVLWWSGVRVPLDIRGNELQLSAHMLADEPHDIRGWIRRRAEVQRQQKRPFD